MQFLGSAVLSMYCHYICVDVERCRRAPEEQHKGIPAVPAHTSPSSGAQLQCVSVLSNRMRCKEGELQMYTHLQGCDLIGIGGGMALLECWDGRTWAL